MVDPFRTISRFLIYCPPKTITFAFVRQSLYYPRISSKNVKKHPKHRPQEHRLHPYRTQFIVFLLALEEKELKYLVLSYTFAIFAKNKVHISIERTYS